MSGLDEQKCEVDVCLCVGHSGKAKVHFWNILDGEGKLMGWLNPEPFLKNYGREDVVNLHIGWEERITRKTDIPLYLDSMKTFECRYCGARCKEGSERFQKFARVAERFMKEKFINERP